MQTEIADIFALAVIPVAILFVAWQVSILAWGLIDLYKAVKLKRARQEKDDANVS